MPLLAMMLFGACQQKTRYITVYRPIQVTCKAPEAPEFEPVETQPTLIDMVAADRRNIVKAKEALKRWEAYKKCVKNQTRK